MLNPTHDPTRSLVRTREGGGDCGRQAAPRPGLHRVTAGRWAALALAAGVVGLSGCARELFSGDPYRSPYDRYDQAQSQMAGDSVVDAYGTRRPNLRARLQPRD